MANHDRRYTADEVASPETQMLVRSAACRIVGQLFAETTHDPSSLGRFPPSTDSEFDDELVGVELGMIADDEEPLRISLRIATFIVAREALQTYAEIQDLTVLN